MWAQGQVSRPTRTGGTHVRVGDPQLILPIFPSHVQMLPTVTLQTGAVEMTVCLISYGLFMEYHIPPFPGKNVVTAFTAPSVWFMTAFVRTLVTDALSR